MKEILLKTIVSEFSKEVIKNSSSLIKDAKDELKYFMDDGVSQYLEKQKTKYVNAKTLLHRTTPVYFYDIYLPARLSCKSKIIPTHSVNKVFWESQFVTIIGAAGSGKSTLIKHLFLNSISEKFSIPILIELRYLNDYKNSIEDFIKEKIFENRLSPSGTIMERLLDNGKFVFFLDGYDEIRSESKEEVVNKLNAFIDKYRLNRFLLTSRPYSNIELLPLFHNYTIESLNDNEIKDFVFRQKIDPELAQKIVQSISESETSYIKSYLANPLLLSLYILTFSTNSSIPKKRYIFYRRVLDVLFKEHDSISKIGYERELLTKMSQEEFEEILKVFSFLSYFEGVYDFEKDYINNLLNTIKKRRPELKFDNNNFIEDIKTALALWTEDSGVYAFAHRSMQEYFAALYVKSLNDNKEEAYKKIQEKLFDSKRRGETSNFLSLCEEMDLYNYRKYMLLPSLIHLDNQINRESNETLFFSGLNCIISGITVQIAGKNNGIDSRNRGSLGPNKENRKYIFTVEHFESTMVHDVFRNFNNSSFLKYLEKYNFQDRTNDYVDDGKRVYSIIFKNLDEEGIKILIKTDIFKTIKKMSGYISDKISEISDFLKESDQSEKDLIDLL